MGILERLVLPGLIVAIILLTYIAMQGDKRARKKVADAQHTESAAPQDHEVQELTGHRTGRR